MLKGSIGVSFLPAITLEVRVSTLLGRAQNLSFCVEKNRFDINSYFYKKMS